MRINSEFIPGTDVKTSGFLRGQSAIAFVFSIVYDSGCTVCATQAITGATATFSVATADTFPGLLISIAMIILSIVIIRGTLFSPGSVTSESLLG